MIRNSRSKWLIAAVLLLVVATLGLSAVLWRRIETKGSLLTQGRGQTSVSDGNRGVPPGLQQTAEGNYVMTLSADAIPTYPDISALASASELIVAGTALENRSKLSPNGKFITIDYQFSVMKVLKGDLWSPTRIITVSLPGGRVPLAPLTTGRGPNPRNYSEIQAPWLKKMQYGRTYVLFLTRSGYLNQHHQIGHFEPAGGAQGIFDVTDGITKSNSGRSQDPIWQYNNLPAGNFVRLIKSSANP